MLYILQDFNFNYGFSVFIIWTEYLRYTFFKWMTMWKWYFHKWKFYDFSIKFIFVIEIGH